MYGKNYDTISTAFVNLPQRWLPLVVVGSCELVQQVDRDVVTVAVEAQDLVDCIDLPIANCFATKLQLVQGCPLAPEFAVVMIALVMFVVGAVAAIVEMMKEYFEQLIVPFPLEF
jgi:hypothetical protein